MAHDVFISHSRHDKPVADAVCAALENAAIRCWIAPRDVQPGRSFAGEITRAIQDSKAMVLIFSSHSNNSEQVLREVQLAVKHHVHILQFRIERVVLSDDFSYFLGTPHWLDALTPPLEAHLQHLAESVKILLTPPDRAPMARVGDGREKAPLPIAGDRLAPGTEPRRGASSLLDNRKLAAGAAVAGFLLLLVWWLVRPARQTPTPEITHYAPAPVMPPAIPEYSVGPENPPQTSGTVHPSAEDIYRQYTEPSVAPEFEVPVRRRAILQHEDRVNDANFSPDGKFIVTASDDQTARLWNAKTGQAVGEPLKHESKVHKAAFTPNGREIVTISNDVRLWDATTQKQMGEPLGTNDLATASLSPDGKRLAITETFVYDRRGNSINQDQTRIWDLERRELVGETLSSKLYYGVHILVFSPDSKRLIASAGENTARIWEVESGKPLGDLLRHKSEVVSASFSPDGKAVATWAGGTKARVWNAETGEQLLELETQTGESGCQILYSPDGKYTVAILGQNYPGQIYDAKTGAAHGQQLPFPYPPTVFSPDSKKLVTFGYANGEDAASIWDVETGRILSRKLKHDGEISAMQFSPDGTVLVTGSYDNTARVWEIGSR